MIERSDAVVIDNNHIYTHLETGSTLRSVSSVYREFIEPFDREGISWMMARKQLRQEISPDWTKGDPEPTDEAIEERKQLILAEWDKKRDNAGEHGTDTHSVAEDIQNGKEVDPKYRDLVDQFHSHYGHYHKCIPEMILHSLKWGVAGTADNPMARQRSDKSVIDIDDWKTNVEKGIVFDSTKFNDETKKLKHYNRFMLHPVDHLEDCNYIHYAIQLSIYGVLLLDMFPAHKIGRLTLTFIKVINDSAPVIKYELTTIPVPFLKLEAEAILDAYNTKYPFEKPKKKVVFDPDDF